MPAGAELHRDVGSLMQQHGSVFSNPHAHALVLLLLPCPADVFEFVLVFVVVHLLSPEHAARLPVEIT